MKIRAEFGLWNLTVVLGRRYRFGVRRAKGSGSAGIGFAVVMWLKRIPATGRRFNVQVMRHA